MPAFLGELLKVHTDAALVTPPGGPLSQGAERSAPEQVVGRAPPEGALAAAPSRAQDLLALKGNRQPRARAAVFRALPLSRGQRA